MTKPRVYVETTVPNFYYDFRPSEAVAVRRVATRRWWATAAERFELVTSLYVHHELSAGRSAWVPLRLRLLDGLPVLPAVREVDTLVEVYIRNKLMPADPVGDAMHLALASFFDCYLELQASGESEQGDAYPSHQCSPRTRHAAPGDPIRAHARRR